MSDSAAVSCSFSRSSSVLASVRIFSMVQAMAAPSRTRAAREPHPHCRGGAIPPRAPRRARRPGTPLPAAPRATHVRRRQPARDGHGPPGGARPPRPPAAHGRGGARPRGGVVRERGPRAGPEAGGVVSRRGGAVAPPALSRGEFGALEVRCCRRVPGRGGSSLRRETASRSHPQAPLGCGVRGAAAEVSLHGAPAHLVPLPGGSDGGPGGNPPVPVSAALRSAVCLQRAQP